MVSRCLKYLCFCQPYLANTWDDWLRLLEFFGVKTTNQTLRLQKKCWGNRSGLRMSDAESVDGCKEKNALIPGRSWEYAVEVTTKKLRSACFDTWILVQHSNNLCFNIVYILIGLEVRWVVDVNGFQTFRTFLTRRDLHGRSQSRGCLLSGALQFFLKFVESNLRSIIKELANKAEPIHHIHLLHVPWLRLGACPLSSLT